jgi:hypothetical protein
VTQATAAGDVRQSFRPSFFFWMTVVMAFFIFSGFGLTYWMPMATRSLAPLPPVVPPDNNNLTYLSVTAIVSFAVLFVLAIRNVRTPDNHKRLILFATINLLPPGVNRLYMVSLGLTELPLLATYLTLDALAIALLIHDWRTLGKLSVASLVGAAFIFVPQLLQPLIVDSAAFASFTEMLVGLAYYR